MKMSSVADSLVLIIEKNEYSKFVIKLVKEITDIFDNLKYVLRHEIKAATIEKLRKLRRKPLNLFKELEKRILRKPRRALEVARNDPGTRYNFRKYP